MRNERSGDDDFSVDELLVKGGVLAFLVGSSHESVAFLLEPLAETKLVLGGSEKLRLLLGVDATLTRMLDVSDAPSELNGHLHRRGREELFPVVKPSRSAF